MDETSDIEKHDNQLNILKTQVKAIMEEAVTKKFVHEESVHVLRLCGTVETCLLDGLKKRTAGFLRFNKIANLYTKVGKSLPDVAELVSKIEETESSFENESRSSQNSIRKSVVSHNNKKHLWVRLALTSKLLARIVEYLVENHIKFYENSSIMSDPLRGEILASLLVGPCALEYSKMKTHDHYWSDPPADELLQRHKLHSRRERANSPGRRPALNFASVPHHSSNESLDRNSSFRDYVESLHQNSKMMLLYGKNNVIVQPREGVGPLPGYLSLHQKASCVMIKWTPNQLMNVPNSSSDKQLNVASETDNLPKSEKENNPNEEGDVRQTISNDKTRLLGRFHTNFINLSSYWEFAISVDVQDIVYLHCHQQSGKGGVLVLVGQDGVQWPPIRFPPGGHLLSFLSCLETGLLPHGSLDPPLWSQKGKGKTFPRLRRRSQRPLEPSSDNDEPTDFVFRVNTSSESSDVTSLLGSNSMLQKSNLTNQPTFDLMQSVSTLPTLLAKSLSLYQSKRSTQQRLLTKNHSQISPSIARSVVIRRQSNPRQHVPITEHYIQPTVHPSVCGVRETDAALQECRSSQLGLCDEKESISRQILEGNCDSSEGFVPHLDMYTWDQNKPRHYDSPSISSDERKTSSSDYSGSSLKLLCDTMRRQIISRAFYGWLAYCRHLSSVRTHLSGLVYNEVMSSDSPSDATCGVTDEVWKGFFEDGKLKSSQELMRYVYFGGVQPSLRSQVWLYLLSYYPPDCNETDRHSIDREALKSYESTMQEWLAVETVVKEREQELQASIILKNSMMSSSSTSSESTKVILKQQSSTLSDVFISKNDENSQAGEVKCNDGLQSISEVTKSHSPPNLNDKKNILKSQANQRIKSDGSHVPYSSISSAPSINENSSCSLKSFSLDGEPVALSASTEKSETVPSVDTTKNSADETGACGAYDANELTKPNEKQNASYSEEFLDHFGLNLHRVDKDVQRCDRNHSYFAQACNLHKLRNIICCYVWRHLDIGYMQGMCDIAAPLLIILDNESVVYKCFVNLMQRLIKNFPNGCAMDSHLANMRSLLQILDMELFEHMHKNGDYTHFSFCYRWFLLDFKRELSYDGDVFAVWECIWAARYCSTKHFFLFFALAMLQKYRDVILENDLDFTDIIKFFNEMAEKHNSKKILASAKTLVAEVQQMIQK